jgi:hypothetical protein
MKEEKKKLEDNSKILWFSKYIFTYFYFILKIK